MKTPHTATARGRTVRIKLRSGEVYEGKFKEKTSGHVMIFEDGRRIAVGEILSMSDRRLLQPRSKHRKL